MWSAVSASFLLAGLAVVILGHLGEYLPVVGGLAVIMLCAEAFARGHLGRFVAELLAAAVVAAAVWLAAWAAAGPLADGRSRSAHPGRHHAVAR